MRPGRISGAAAVYAAASLLLASAPAAAQVTGIPRVEPITPPGVPSGIGEQTVPEGVLERPRPELEPQGLQIGGFQVLPSVTGIPTYDSNIFATQKSPTGDFVFHVRPELIVNNQKEPAIFGLNFDGYVEDVRYVDHGSLGHDDFGGTLDLFGDYSPLVRIESRTAYNYVHQDPASFTINVTTGALTHLPVLTTFSEDLSATRDVGLLGLTLNGGYGREDYENFTINGVTINQTQLDNNAFKIGPKVSYEVTPGIRPYVAGQYDRREYDHGVFDSNGFSLTTGSDFELSRLVHGGAYIGYKERDYNSSTISNVSGFTYGLNLAWYPTERLTITGTGLQDFSDTTITTANGVHSVLNAKIIRGEADYEVLRQVIVSGIASYENDDYGSTTRVDDIVTAGTGLKYIMNRNVTLFGQYLYSTRSSTLNGFNYDRHRVGVGLTLAY